MSKLKELDEHVETKKRRLSSEMEKMETDKGSVVNIRDEIEKATKSKERLAEILSVGGIQLDATRHEIENAKDEVERMGAEADEVEAESLHSTGMTRQAQLRINKLEGSLKGKRGHCDYLENQIAAIQSEIAEAKDRLQNSGCTSFATIRLPYLAYHILLETSIRFLSGCIYSAAVKSFFIQGGGG